jgi:hypothetical protein
MWSWVLAVIGVTGIYFVGRKTIWGWIVLLFNEVLWITYAVVTAQYGFIFSAIAYAAVYIRSYMHWRAEEFTVEEMINLYGINSFEDLDTID